MDSIGKALIYVMLIDLMIFLGSVAVVNINPEASSFYTYEGSMLSKFDAGNYTLDANGTSARLPDNPESISESVTNWITDTWVTVRTWILDSTGLGYLLQILSGPANILQMLELPQEFVYSIGAFWYAITLFLLVSWGLGK